MPPKRQFLPAFQAENEHDNQQQQHGMHHKYDAEHTPEDVLSHMINSLTEGNDEDVLGDEHVHIMTAELAGDEDDAHANDGENVVEGEQQFVIDGLHDEQLEIGEGEETDEQPDEGEENFQDDENLDDAAADADADALVGEGDEEIMMIMQNDDGLPTDAEPADENDGFLYIMEKDLPLEKRLKLWAKLNKGQKCAVADCFCSTTGAYFPNPYKAHINSDQRRQEEARLDFWSDFCQRGENWTPQITSRRIQDFIGWMHFNPDDITEHRRIRLHVPQAFKRLKKGATPVNPTILTRDEKLLCLGVQETTRQRKRRERVEKAAEVAANASSSPKNSHAGRIFAKQNLHAALQAKQLPLKRLENALKHERRMRSRLEEEIDKLKVQVARGVEGKCSDRTTKGIANEMQQLRAENKELRAQIDALKTAIANSIGPGVGGSQVIMVQLANDI